MKPILFVVLFIGSIYFLGQFLPDARTTGSGDTRLLIAWSIRRCVVDLGIYVCFVSVIFGTYFFSQRNISETAG